jgi:tRNA (uracil-5-)-methyltransferase
VRDGRRIVATEVSKASVAAAQHNLEANAVSNVFVARMSSEEFVDAWREKRAMERLRGLDWDAVDLRTILVDPPRWVDLLRV